MAETRKSLMSALLPPSIRSCFSLSTLSFHYSPQLQKKKGVPKCWPCEKLNRGKDTGAEKLVSFMNAHVLYNNTKIGYACMSRYKKKKHSSNPHLQAHCSQEEGRQVCMDHIRNDISVDKKGREERDKKSEFTL